MDRKDVGRACRQQRWCADPPGSCRVPDEEIGLPPHGGFAMLVLSRKQSERIVIGDDIVLTVVRNDRNQVRPGIEAPPHVPIVREELCPAAPAASLVPSSRGA